jgi:hypothetical protein
MSIHLDPAGYLHYLFQTASNGLRCSLDNLHTQEETLELTMCNTRGQNIYVSKIEIVFPLGDDRANTLTGSTNLTYVASPSNLYKIIQQSPGYFVITPLSGKYITFLNQAIYMRFSGIVMNTTPGIIRVDVKETSTENSNGSNSKTNTTRIWIGKYPYQFYLTNFSADKAVVTSGQSVNLSWVGAYNGNYTLNWSDATGPRTEDVTNVRVWKSPPLTQSTVFQLVGVSVDGDRKTVQLERGVVVSG